MSPHARELLMNKVLGAELAEQALAFHNAGEKRISNRAGQAAEHYTNEARRIAAEIIGATA